MNFYLIDFSIGIIIVVGVTFLYLTKRITNKSWLVYWIGFLLGLTWELPMSIANEYSPCPPARFITPMPTHFMIIVITHSFWDGGLFLLGYLLILKICDEPHFEHFDLRELGVLLVWGQLSELAVELVSTFNEAWVFNIYWWNPLLFKFYGHNITLLPQIIWLMATFLFYWILLKSEKNRV
ncbi:MAG: hypothetical protein ACOC4M_14965 [Promethearchaeia archaeon]